jgi:hypothetical protein
MTRRALFAMFAAALAGRKLLPAAAPDEALAAAQTLRPMYVVYNPKYSIGWSCKYDEYVDDVYMKAVCARLRRELARREEELPRQIYGAGMSRDST